MKILVIEDNPINLKLVRDFLRNTDYELFSSNNAEQGVEIAKAEQPDLILMDIRMPKLDGLAATRILKRDDLTKHIKVVAVTAYAMKGDRERILAAGCDGYLAKPFLHKEFMDLVQSFDPALSDGPE